MTAIQNFFQNLLYQIPKIGISDIIDILVVSFLIYTVLRLVRSSSAARVAWTVLVLLIATWLTSVFDLYACNWILNKILELGFISLVVIFQPEIRRAMERFGGKFFLNLVDPASKKSVEESAIEATVSACEIMSKERVGVLLIFERSVSLEEYFKTGTIVDARVSEQLLRNLFFPKAALHDGAAIIRGGRVAAATSARATARASARARSRMRWSSSSRRRRARSPSPSAGCSNGILRRRRWKSCCKTSCCRRRTSVTATC